MKILLVEDTVGEPIAKVLQKWGHEVLLAGTVQDARTTLKINQVDLLIVDWMLPGESGMDLVQHLQAGGQRQAPVLMISGRMSPADVVAAHDGGVNSYLAKPFTAVQLRTRIDEVLEEWNQQQSLVPTVDRILHAATHSSDRNDFPIVLLAERACTRTTLLRAGRAVIDSLAGLVDAIEAANAEQLDLHLGFHLVDSSAELVTQLQKRAMRPRVRLVVISAESGGTPVAAARMLSTRDDAPPLVMVCNQPDDLGLKTWYSLEQRGVGLERRGQLKTERWTQLLQQHILDKPPEE